MTSGQSNLTKGRIAAAHRRFDRIRQVTPMKIFIHQEKPVATKRKIKGKRT